MVYKTGRDPSYSKPICDLCNEKIDSDSTMFIIEDGSPFGVPPTGTKKHEGHFCPNCDPSGGVTNSVEFYKFQSINDTIVMLQIFSHGRNSETRYLPDEMPDTVKEALDEFIDRQASRLSY